MDCVIGVGVVLSFWDTCVFEKFMITNQPLWQSTIFWILFVVSIFYTAGLCIEIFSVGFERFWYRKPCQHRFDFLNVLSLIAVQILYFVAFPSSRALERA